MPLQATIRCLSVNIIACTLLIASLSESALAQEKFILKLGHTLAPESHYQLAALEFAKLVQQNSGGKVEVQVFPQSQLGGEVQMTQALRTGTQDMMFAAQAVVANTIKEWQIFDVPYLFSSIEEANQVLQGAVGEKYLAMMQRHNIIGLAWLSALERDVFTAKKPISTLNDMSTLKIRVMQSPGYIAAYRSLNANPTPMAYSQLYLALQQGLVDGADTSPDQMILDKFTEVAKYFHLTHVHYLPVVLAISKASWDKLPANLQQAVRKAGSDAARFDIGEYRRQYDEALAALPKKGVQVKSIDVTPWEKASEAARNELLEKIPNGHASYKEIVAAKVGKAK